VTTKTVTQLEAEFDHARRVALASVGQDDYQENIRYRNRLQDDLIAARITARTQGREPDIRPGYRLRGMTAAS
jgi:hypothetical protein